ncbi:MAG: DUF58 domain-containing protein [Thermoguttaceae bacterium]|nr:DUF58 domain-containing protein [Thermoguttaceae bacterium]
MEKTEKTRNERGGAKRRRTVLFQDGLGALSVAAFLFLGATIREVNLLMALGAFFAGFAVLDYWQGRRSLRRLRVFRKTPDAIFAGEPFEVEIEIDATRRRSSAWGVVVEDEWTRQEGDRELWAAAKQEGTAETVGAVKTGEIGKEKRKEKEGKGNRRNKKNSKGASVGEAAQDETRPNVAATTRPTAYFPQIKGGERRRERYCGVVARRGVRRLATLTASTRFPFGFFRSSERFDAPDEILVFPKIGVLTDRWNAASGVARRETTVSTARTSRIAGETLTVRDWRPDDSKRAIHWRATAKRDKLQARDFEKRENSVNILILDLFFDEGNASEPDLDLWRGWNEEFKGDGEKETVAVIRKEAKERKNRQKTKRPVELDAQEQARRSALVEKAVSFAATLIDRWTRSNDAKFLLAVNGDDPTAFNENGAQVGLGKMGDMGALSGRVESGNGAFRRALTRLATVEAPSRDRLAEISASLDPRALANAQIYLVSVAAFDGARLAENTSETDKANKTGEMRENGKNGGKEELGEVENSGESEAVATAAARGIDGRWRDARLIDVSATDFNDYFEY